MKRISVIGFLSSFLLVAISLHSCISSNQSFVDVTGYDFTMPDKILVLPDTLREISGLTFLDNQTIACVQDENGIVFTYNLEKNEIDHQFVFHGNGDYEGLTNIGDTLYILQSDGVLFQIAGFSAGNCASISYQTNIPSGNNEGLCYDAANHQLLIACKGKLGKGSEFKDKRAVFAFDIEKHTLSPEPVIEFDLQEIKQFCTDHRIDLPVRSKKNGSIEEPVIKFRPSAIAIHPETGKLFVLSAADHMFFIFSRDGKIEHAELLDPALFNKAEGISFMNNADLLISNEGQEGKPKLLLFQYSR